MSADVVTVQRTINAQPAIVFSFFTDRDRWLSWQGVTAEIDPRPGGMFRMNVRGDGVASGRFTTVEPHRRIVFTWGWEGDDSPVPPGSSTVQITLEMTGDCRTRLTLVHSGLPLPALDTHRDGWNHYLTRLAIRAGGGDPGPDAIGAGQLTALDVPLAAGTVLARMFQALAIVRRSKPLHPKGVVLSAVLHRTGAAAQPWGAPWLDKPGEDHGLARLSRAVGLPRPLPDILGLALTFNDTTGARHDLLLASTGLGFPTRFILTPRRDPITATYSCLLPYASARGPVLLAAVPSRNARTRVKAASFAFRMLAAAPRGAWQEFGLLRLARRPNGDPDPPVRFDPVLNELPGLRYYPSLAKLREPSYAGARSARPAP